MTSAVEALSADRTALLEICEGLSEADWEAESGCAGWSVKDLIAHMGSLFWAAIDPSVLPDTSGLPTERAQDVCVDARRSLTFAEVRDDYAAVSERALTALAGLSEADFDLPLGDLGTYPAAVLPTAFCFDQYVHIRADLFGPRGPLTGPPPPSDELRLAPALDWIEAAAPQQNQTTLASLGGPVEIVLTGCAARTMRLGPDGQVAASVQSDADACVRWITQRATWEEVGAQARGGQAALDLVRTLKVF